MEEKSEQINVEKVMKKIKFKSTIRKIIFNAFLLFAGMALVFLVYLLILNHGYNQHIKSLVECNYLGNDTEFMCCYGCNMRKHEFHMNFGIDSCECSDNGNIYYLWTGNTYQQGIMVNGQNLEVLGLNRSVKDYNIQSSFDEIKKSFDDANSKYAFGREK